MKFLPSPKRGSIKIWTIIIAISTFVFSLNGWSREPVGGPWYTLESPHFKVHHQKEQKAFSRLFLNYLEEAHLIFDEWFPELPEEKTHVVISRRLDTFNGFAQVFPFQRMTVFPVAPEPISTLGETDDWIRQLAIHEYVHIAHLQIQDGFYGIAGSVFGTLFRPNMLLPLWMIEGLAVWGETRHGLLGRGRNSFMEMLLREAVREKRILKTNEEPKSLNDITLDRLNQGTLYWPSGIVPYLFGYLFVEEMAQGSSGNVVKSEVIKRWIKFSSTRIPYFDFRTIKDSSGRSVESIWNRMVDRLRERLSIKNKRIKLQGTMTRTRWQSKEGRQSGSLTPLRWQGTELESALIVSDPEKGRVLKRIRFDLDGNLKDPEVISEKDLLYLDSPGENLAPIPNSTRLLFSQIENTKNWQVSSSLFEVDWKTGKSWKLPTTEHAVDPSVHDSGEWIVYVKLLESGNQSLVMRRLRAPKDQGQAHRLELKERVLYTTKSFSRIVRPRWAKKEYKDWIVFSLRSRKGLERLVALHLDRKQLVPLTDFKNTDFGGVYSEFHPSLDPSGRYLTFVADYEGSYSMYRMPFEPENESLNSVIYRLGNTQTGFFHPLSTGKGWLFADHYTDEGFKGSILAERDLKKIAYEPTNTKASPRLREKLWDIEKASSDLRKPSRGVISNDKLSRDHYSPFDSIHPQWWLGLISFSADEENSYTNFQLITSGQDALQRHLYSLSAGVVEDQALWSLVYQYNRFEPALQAGYFGGNSGTCGLIRGSEDHRCGNFQAIWPLGLWDLRAGVGWIEFPEEDEFFRDRSARGELSLRLNFTDSESGAYSLWPEWGLSFDSEINFYPERESIEESTLWTQSLDYHHGGPFRGDGFKWSFLWSVSDGPEKVRPLYDVQEINPTAPHLHAIRGYESDPFYGSWLINASLDYEVALWRIQRGLLGWPFFFRHLSWRPFLEAATGQKAFIGVADPEWISSIGSEWRLRGVFGYRVPWSLVAGIHHGLDQEYGADTVAFLGFQLGVTGAPIIGNR